MVDSFHYFPINEKMLKKVLYPVCTRWSKIAVVMVLIAMAIFCSAYFRSLGLEKTNEKLDAWYLLQLKQLKTEVKKLQQLIEGGKSIASCQQQFKQARSIYKKAAVFIEYFNLYESRYLNGPNLKRTEEDNPDAIIEPRGFQVIEENLFSKAKSVDLIKEEFAFLLNAIEKLEAEPDRIYKFRDEEVWEALRMAVLRMITLGISGFDSPVALNSLPEAKASLQGIAEILAIYKQELEKKYSGMFLQLDILIQKAQANLLTTSFDQFNRLEFIMQFANPITRLLNTTRIKLGYTFPTGLRPLNAFNTIFDSNAFNLDYFSPNSRFRMSPERIELGKQLFNDPIISGTKKRSCATCHQPEKAFADGRPTALSLDETSVLERNTPTLWNTVFQTKQFYDSRTSVLENQLSEVVHNPKEMKGSLKESITILKNDERYNSLFKKAYPDEKDFISEYNIANAISSYVRSLVALNSRFDLYIRGNLKMLTSIEKKGFNLFMGKAKCGTCHYLPLFNGLVPPEFTETESEVLGVPKTKDTLNAKLDDDLGKFKFTNSVVHKYAFKTPTLRNVELTAPYMHNGVFTTLEEVMEFYNRGGGSGLHIAPESQTLPPEKLHLSKYQIKCIIAFMKSLTDTKEDN